MKFLVMLLNKGKAGGKQTSEESVELLKQIQTQQVKSPMPQSGSRFRLCAGQLGGGRKDGKAGTLACPGLFGTWPMVDFAAAMPTSSL